MKHLIITGIQGSGKGTQARKIAKDFKWVHIGTGDWCRWHIKNRTLYGKQLLKINRGDLVSDDVIIKLVQFRLDMHDFSFPFLLDGFPRSMPQAEYLFEHYQIAAVINLVLDQKVALERAMARVESGEVRKDDNEDALKNRFDLYHKHTKPLLQLYEQKGILINIDGSGNKDEVYQLIKKSLKGVDLS